MCGEVKEEAPSPVLLLSYLPLAKVLLSSYIRENALLGLIAFNQGRLTCLVANFKNRQPMNFFRGGSANTVCFLFRRNLE